MPLSESIFVTYLEATIFDLTWSLKESSVLVYLKLAGLTIFPQEHQSAHPCFWINDIILVD